MHQNNSPVHNSYLRFDSNFYRGFQRLSMPASKSKSKIRNLQYFSNEGQAGASQVTKGGERELCDETSGNGSTFRSECLVRINDEISRDK